MHGDIPMPRVLRYGVSAVLGLDWIGLLDILLVERDGRRERAIDELSTGGGWS